jgi:hypothetical protein
LTRDTDRLVLAAGGAAGAGEAGVPRFGRLQRFEYLDQPSKWLIARQIAGVLVK